MKRLSLQWRITLMSVLLIGITCVAMNLLLCSSGVYYMDTIADSLQGGGTAILNEGAVIYQLVVRKLPCTPSTTMVNSSLGAMSCGSKLAAPPSLGGEEV